MKNIIIFGAGSCGQRHFHEIQDNVICFVDNDKKKQGNNLFGKKIISPEDIKDIEFFDYIVISSIYEAEIKKQLIHMGLADKILTIFNVNKKIEHTPVNFNHFNFSKENIKSDAMYAYNIARGYISKLPKGVKSIKNSSILEIGPGINFGAALILICLGAKKVTVSDRFLTQYSNKYHSYVYQAIIDILKKEYISVDVSPLVDCIQKKSHKTEKLLPVQCSLEGLSNVFPEEFDITFSNAVFEHLYNPLEAFKSLYKCMGKVSIGYHQVDFRDHRDFNRPLEFLLLDELSFYSLMNNASCEFGNRLRDFQMQSMFENVGFKNICLNINMKVSHDYFNDFLERLNSNRISIFSEVEPENLKNISGNFLIYKIED